MRWGPLGPEAFVAFLDSAMDAFDGDPERVRLLDQVLHSIGAVMDGF